MPVNKRERPVISEKDLKILKRMLQKNKLNLQKKAEHLMTKYKNKLK